MNKKDKQKEIDKLLEKTNKTRFNNFKETLELAEIALSMSIEIDYELGKAVALLRMANAYVSLGNYEKALDIIFDSLDYFVKENIYDLQFDVFNNLGIIFNELGDYERSMGFFYNAEIVAKQIDNEKKYNINASTKGSIVLVLNNIAENYKLLSDYEEALNYYSRAYEIDKELDYKPSKGITLLSLGEIYYLLKDYEKAKAFTYDAIKYMDYYNNTIANPDAFVILALVSWKENNFKVAEEYFDKAINISHKKASPYTRINILINHFEYLEEQKNFKDALNALHNACNLSLQNNMLDKTTEIAALLGELYDKIGDHKSAYKYFKMHYQYEKSSFDLLKKQRISSLNAKKKIQQIEKEKIEMEKNNENLKRESEALQVIVEKISIISDLGREITATLNLDSIIDILNTSINNFIDITYFGIGLYDEKNACVDYLDVVDNGKKTKILSTPMDNKCSFSVNCIKTGQIIIINDMSKEFSNYVDYNSYKAMNDKNKYELNSLIFSPLLINNKVIGVMTIQSKKKNAFTTYHIEMIKSLSSYAAIAVNNAIKSKELEKEIERTREAQIELFDVNQKLLYLSENDSMTGIYNRRKFDCYLNDIWDISKAEKNPISLILFDIDCFKEYNDNYGHVEGDKCIISVAKSLSNLGEQQYFTSRYGGDEFAILLPKCSLENAIEYGNKIKNKIAELNISHEFSKVSKKVTISIGITSVVPNNTITINEFIRNADISLYEAKGRGRNQIVGIK